jgi:polyvinyl alcohol dehydrogenase (cytochrome)
VRLGSLSSRRGRLRRRWASRRGRLRRRWASRRGRLRRRWGLLLPLLPWSGLLAVSSLPAACGATTAKGTSTDTNVDHGGQALPPLDCSGSGDDWPMFGQNICNTRAAPSGGPIDPSTASRLAVKWTFNAAGDISATPAVVGNDVYVPDWGGMLHRIDARTGKAVWSKSVAALVGMSVDASASGTDTPAAVVSRVTPVVTDSSVILGLARGSIIGTPSLAILLAVDRQTGSLQWQTLLDAHPAAFITASPVLENGTIYVGVSSGEESLTLVSGYACCTFRGSVVALDASTGKIRWKTYTIEDSAYFQNDGRTPSGFSGAAVWSGTPVVDRRRHSLYITTGNNYSAPNGSMTLPPGDHIESILSLDMDTGAIRWAQRVTTGDLWTGATFILIPSPAGPDWDFGSGANLFRTEMDGAARDVVGAGQKSGIYWAVDPDTGGVLWKQQVGPGGHFGGIHWGPAVDEHHVYVGVNNETNTPYTLGGNGPKGGQQTSAGSWAALDPSTGHTEWQIANPAMTAPLNGASVNGPLAAVNGVVFGGSMDAQGTMFAFDGASGAVLWSFPSGGTVYGGAAVSRGVVYWGNGYPTTSRLGFGTPGGKLYAFQIGP